ncbi:MAG TPA: HNH endonuclease [Azospirillaceae bacterium]|nr:HNH endonuclease [Azospirillaceae bacterium]
MKPFDPDRLLAAQGGRCFYCGDALGRGATVDHLIPQAYGGIDDVANCVMAHRRCNQLKGDRLPTADEIDRLVEERKRSRLPVWPPLLAVRDADPDQAWMECALAIREWNRANPPT